MTYVAAEDRYESMTYRRVGRSGVKLPLISLGLWHNFGDDRSLDTQRAILRRAFDLGVCHIDLANNYGPPYGSAETNFGTILRQDLLPYRDELFLSTKAGWDMWPGPYGEFGSRKYLLFIHQPSYSMLNRWVEGGLLDTLEQVGAGCIAFSPLAQGMLTNKYLNGIPSDSRMAEGSSLSEELLTEQNLTHLRSLNEIALRRGQSLAQMALAWIARDPRVSSVLIGASSVGQLEQNIAALDNLEFSAEELAEIDNHAVEGGIDLWRGQSTT